MSLSSGETVDAWTYDGQLPGPELRVRQGELVEVTLLNRDIDAGVTLHWHGLDVPNAEDGVAGITQNAVLPGGRHVYRFRVEQAGTFWYHSHQQSNGAVARGLFGALVAEPRAPTGDAAVRDLTVVAHTFPVASGGTVTALGPAAGLTRTAVAPGSRVRLRLVNTDNDLRVFLLTGAAFRLAAIDGTDLNGPGDLTDVPVEVAAGGRDDLTFTMPDGPVELAVVGGESLGAGAAPAMLFSRDRTGGPKDPGQLTALGARPPVNPIAYGIAAPTPFGPDSHFDRRYTLLLGFRLGFHDGSFGGYFTINGRLHPDTPTLLVRRGELVAVAFANRSFDHHPMHLHGHRMLVLRRDGLPATGSPWWTDTLDVAPGGSYEVAFRADNPGVWMDHCHNLKHAHEGMTMHVAYEGVETPFETGSATANQPE
jgi:FtsP/CotA-like multicopper oxidase with cupredoxin domain